MSSPIRRRKVLLAGLAGAVLAALGTVASPYAAPDTAGLIVVSHHTPFDGGETAEIATIDPSDETLRVLTASVPGTTSEDPVWDAHGNHIYFDSDRAGNVHLFVIDGEGRGLRQVLETEGFEFEPAVSAGGKLLAFDHYNAGFTNGGIYVGPKHGDDLAEFHQVTTAPLAVGGFDGSPDFSPDGKRIAFVRVVGTTHGSGQAGIFVVGVDGTGLTQLTPYALDAEHPRWSPDGSTIVFSTNADNFPKQAEIDVVPAAGGPITQLTHDPLPVQNFAPDWSPDGSLIVFDRWMGFSHFDLMSVAADGSGLTTVWHGTDGSFDFRPAWSSRP